MIKMSFKKDRLDILFSTLMLLSAVELPTPKGTKTT